MNKYYNGENPYTMRFNENQELSNLSLSQFIRVKLDSVIFWTRIRERSKLQRKKFRRKGYFYPFREIYLAGGSFSPKTSSKNVQSRVKVFHK